MIDQNFLFGLIVGGLCAPAMVLVLRFLVDEAREMGKDRLGRRGWKPSDEPVCEITIHHDSRLGDFAILPRLDAATDEKVQWERSESRLNIERRQLTYEGEQLHIWFFASGHADGRLAGLFKQCDFTVIDKT